MGQYQLLTALYGGKMICGTTSLPVSQMDCSKKGGVMKVIAAKSVSESAREWLCNYGAAIEQVRGLVIVFLPDHLCYWRSEMREMPHYITFGPNCAPAVFVEPGSDDVRSIYMRGDDDDSE